MFLGEGALQGAQLGREAGGVRVIHYVVDETMPLREARRGLAKMAEGEVFGKIVLTV